MDEGVISLNDLLEFIRLDMLDGMAMYPGRGLLPARQQLRSSRMPGCSSSGAA